MHVGLLALDCYSKVFSPPAPLVCAPAVRPPLEHHAQASPSTTLVPHARMVWYIPSRSSLDACLQARLGGLRALVGASVRRLAVSGRRLSRRHALGSLVRLVLALVQIPAITRSWRRLSSLFPGKACQKKDSAIGLLVEDLARPSPSGRPGSSTPAGFARMEPALCRIPLPYPSPWRPRKSRDRARPGWEVVAPRAAGPPPCHTFRLFSIVLGTEKLMVINLSVAIAKSRRITILIFS